MTQVLKLVSNVWLPKHSASLTTALLPHQQKAKEVFLIALNALPSSYPAHFNHFNLEKGKHIMQEVFSFLFGEVNAIFCRTENHRMCVLHRGKSNSMLQYSFGCHSFCFVLSQHQVGADEILRLSFSSSPHLGGFPIPGQPIHVSQCTSAQQTERGELD